MLASLFRSSPIRPSDSCSDATSRRTMWAKRTTLVQVDTSAGRSRRRIILRDLAGLPGAHAPALDGSAQRLEGA